MQIQNLNEMQFHMLQNVNFLIIKFASDGASVCVSVRVSVCVCVNVFATVPNKFHAQY